MPEKLRSLFLGVLKKEMRQVLSVVGVAVEMALTSMSVNQLAGPPQHLHTGLDGGHGLKNTQKGAPLRRAVDRYISDKQ
jgi:hypothetical protein